MDNLLDTSETTICGQSSFHDTGHFFARATSQNPSLLSSDSHLQNIILNSDQYSTNPAPNRVDYPLNFIETLVSHPRQDSEV